MRPFLPAARLAAALCAVSAACADRVPSLLPATDPAPAPANAAVLRCTVAVRAGTLACERVGPPSAVRGVILGGQGVNVRLASSGTSYDAGTQILRSDVTVQNLTGQALGTTDGYLPAPEGVRVFFASAPIATAGFGAVTVDNPDGTGVFTSSGQAYFQYDGVLLPGDTTAAREWRFSIPPTVETFAFTVHVNAPVPREQGWVKLAPIAPSMQVGDTIAMSAAVRTVTGKPAAGPVAWTTSDSAVATVSAAGVLTGTGPGTATITAASGGRSGHVTVVVTAESETPPPTIVSFTVSPEDVTADGGDTVWAEVHVRSPIGISQVWAVVAAPHDGMFLQCFPQQVSGTPFDGVFRCSMVIPAGANHGAWTSGLWASNPTQRGLGPDDLLAAGDPVLLSVRSPNEDFTPPAGTGLAFHPDTVRAGDSVTVDVSFTEAGVGANQGGAIFFNEDSPNVLIGCGTNNLVAGTAHAGTFRCTFVVPAGTVPGTWNGLVQLIDANSNVGYTQQAELEAAGSHTTLIVLAPGSP